MENKLRQLFDYQKFMKNKNLESIIANTEQKHKKVSLNDEQLSNVWAAGETDTISVKNKKGENDEL